MIILVEKSAISEERLAELILALVGFSPFINDYIYLKEQRGGKLVFTTPASVWQLEEAGKRFFEKIAHRFRLREGDMTIDGKTITPFAS
jgi:hypothetical protein